MTVKVVDVAWRADFSQYRRELKTGITESQNAIAQLQKMGSTSSNAFKGATNETAKFTAAQKKAATEAGGIGKATKEAEGVVRSAAVGMRDALKSVVTTAIGFDVALGFAEGARKFTEFAKEATRQGIDLSITLKRTETIFGESAEGVIRSVEAMGRKYGTNNDLMLKTADTFGVVARGAHLSGEETAQVANELTKTTANAAAFWKTSPENVMTAIRGGLLGMNRGLKTYGVSLTQTEVQQRAVTMGLTQAGQVADQHALVLARASIIQEKFAQTNGTLAQQSTTFAGQLRIVQGNIVNWVEEVGAHALPTFALWLSDMRTAGREALPILERAIHAMGPGFRDFASAGRSVWETLVDVEHAVGPLAGLLAKLAIGGIVLTFNALGAVLKVVTRGIHDFEPGIVAVAAALATGLIPALATTIAEMAALAPTAIGVGFITAAEGVSAFSAAIGVSTIALAGFAVAFAGVALAYEYFQNASADSGTSGFIKTLGGQNKSLDALTKERDETATRYQAAAAKYNNTSWTFSRLNPFGDSRKQLGDTKALSKAYDDLNDQITKLQAQQVDAAKATGLNAEHSAQLAGESADQTKALSDALVGAAAQTHLTGDALVNMWGDDSDAVKAYGDAVAKAMDATKSAFAADSDVVSGAGSLIKQAETEATNSTKTHTDAVKKLGEAQKHLSDLNARHRVDAKFTVADSQALADANQKVADAQKAVAAATVTTVDKAGLVRQFYQDTVRQNTSFLTNINQAIQRGLDPALVARLLEQGPQKAGPILEGILADHSGRMITLANDAEQKLQQISDEAVEMSRLTNLAINAKTDDLRKNLKLAMQIAQEEMVLGGKATADEVAKALKLDPQQVKDIADSYGISGATTRGFSTPQVPTAEAWSGPALAGQNRVYGTTSDGRTYKVYRDGRIVWLPQPPTPAQLSDFYQSANGNIFESHHPAILGPSAGVRQFNEPEAGGEAYIPLGENKRAAALPILNRVNAMFSSYANGGVVGGGAGAIIPTYSRSNNWNFYGGIHGADFNQIQREAQRKQRFANLTGSS